MKKNTMYIVFGSILFTLVILAMFGIINLDIYHDSDDGSDDEDIEKTTTIFYPNRSVLSPPIFDYDTQWTRPYVVRQPPVIVGPRHFRRGGYYNPLFHNRRKHRLMGHYARHNKKNVHNRHFHKKVGYHKHRPHLF